MDHFAGGRTGDNFGFPLAGWIGLGASALAAGLWGLAQWTGGEWIWIALIPVKLVVVGAPFYFLEDLCGVLGRRPGRSVLLAGTLIGVSLAALFLFAPWRHQVVAGLGHATYHWYYPGMEEDGFSFHDAARWEAAWDRRLPHLLEAGLIGCFYLAVVGGCSFGRLRRGGAAVLMGSCYGLLVLVPHLAGQVVWDYDVFLKGIAMDSIAFDLMPLMLWSPGDHSIFLFVFLFLFFAVSALFHRAVRRATPQFSTRKK